MARLAAAVSAADWAAPTGPLTRYRGDGWQVLIERPERALRLALVLQASLRADAGALATRIAIGLGPVTRRGTRDLSDADGPAFHRAGDALDHMKRGRRLSVGPEGAPEGWLSAVPLLDALAHRWSRPQAETLAEILAPDAPTQAQLAERSGIAPQSLSDRLNTAAFPEVELALERLENQVPRPDSRKSGNAA